MVNFELLEQKIKESGMTIIAISSKSGMLRETLYNRLRGNTDFKASEITRLSQTLHLSARERDDIFFANESELNSQSKSIGDVTK